MKRSKEEISFCEYCDKKVFLFEKYYHKFKYCSLKCSAKGMCRNNIEKWKNGEQIGYRSIKRYLIEIHGEKCEKCNWAERNEITNNIPLEIHHKDGDYKNNKENNLEILCPNCHSLTPNYKRLNKNSSRTNRK